ncbi:pantoate--beta-alanine ligase [Paenibacillus abyssi]|uniref:Pantothenate synthetase n=1 Tax=Paenibacillus abyssi TaxID=1340531 RepID=A0A917FKE3_9BACL|nr:pantoate--beta-alanine ligase [Paenibacillus abyssi]GGF89062.1 pantothenate synthetase [Paenibacillus abyssi]
MIKCETIDEMRKAISAFRREKPDGVVGFVPTMGYLHEGHASLMKRSATECDLTVLSIFVNPLQFGPNEDFDRYPRDPERDMALAKANDVDIVFMPSVQEMYPRPIKTKVLVEGITSRLCGASRPGHFDGVGTVVSKLFHIVSPDRAYFGMKDAQQVAVITKMTEDLNLPVSIIPCETIRESDGLALSSRNVYLSEEERKQAVILSQALDAASELLKLEDMTADRLVSELHRIVKQAELAVIDYIDVLLFPDLTEPDGQMDLSKSEDQLIVAMAVRFGKTRLIDNRLFSRKEVACHV